MKDTNQNEKIYTTTRKWMLVPGVTRAEVVEAVVARFSVSKVVASRVVTDLNMTMQVFPIRARKATAPPAEHEGNKVCASCGKEKSLDSFITKKRRNGKIEIYAYCKTCHSLYQKQVGIRKKFNLSLDERDLLGNKCMICGFIPKEGKSEVAVDHNHKTGLIRGRLCSRCNRGIAWFQERPDLFLSAYKYLTDPPASAILGEERYGMIGSTGKRRKFAKHHSLLSMKFDD